MSWAELTIDEVRTQLSGPELTALQTFALSDGQADPLPGVIEHVTDEVRGYIAARTGNTLGPSGTLPAQAISAAISIIRWRLAGRLGIGQAAALLQTPQRETDYRDAVTFLQAISSGKVAVEQPPANETGPEVAESEQGKWGSNAPINFNV